MGRALGLVVLLLLLASTLGCSAAMRGPDEITIRRTQEEEARQRPARPDAGPSVDRR